MIDAADLKILGPALPDGWYVAEFDFPGYPGNVERIVVQCRDGLCLQTNEADYEDGPLPMAETGYRIVKKIDPWAR